MRQEAHSGETGGDPAAMRAAERGESIMRFCNSGIMGKWDYGNAPCGQSHNCILSQSHNSTIPQCSTRIVPSAPQMAKFLDRALPAEKVDEEYEQNGSDLAIYGAGLMRRLARDLSLKLGRGFSHANLVYMRKLYVVSQKSQMSDLFKKSQTSGFFDLEPLPGDSSRRRSA